MPSQTDLNSMHQTRRDNLQLLLRAFSEKEIVKGSTAKGLEGAFAAHIGVTAITLSHLKRSRNISDKVASQVESACSIERGWMSEPHGELTPSAAQQQFENLARMAWQAGNAKAKRDLMRLAKNGFIASPPV
jgi:hypothetical protein